MTAGFGLDDVAEIKDERTRSITAENPEGEVGAGGQAASELGQSRKGSPNIDLPQGEETTIADVDGPGKFTHFWITVRHATDVAATVLRDLVVRIYWDDEDEPSVEVPLGDFFCNGHAQRNDVDSLPVVVAPSGGLNCFWPMPFREHAEVTIENQHPKDVNNFFYQIDYTLDPDITEDTAYFHAQWRRENPTTRGEDYTILDGVEGEGHYVGTYLAWTTLEGNWWGEGEVKFYIDGDDEFPTICGTGTEDYVGGAWCFTRPGAHDTPITYSTPFMGYPLYDDESSEVPYHSLYRWHLPDPIRFTEDIRATVQQIGITGEGYFERSDDISSVAYWYQREPHAPFPDLPDREARKPR